jgi:thiol-disulfide isomerase/thioredoxin
MSRWAILLGLFALAGCSGKKTEPPTMSRYEAVKAPAEPVSHWCDTSFGGDAPHLTLPPLAPAPAGRPQPTLLKGKPTWVNLWATWCQPCLREIPLLIKWQGELRKDGVDVDVLLLSLDEDGPTLDKFLAGRKDLQTARIARVNSESDYQQWAKAFLKDPSMPIPIHLLSSADGGVRCVRNGSLHEGDYPAAKSVFGPRTVAGR